MLAALWTYRQAAMGAVAGALLSAGPVYLFGSNNGYDNANLDRLKADVQIERDRNKDDARISKLSDFDLCVQSLRARKLRVDVCEQLRGVSGE